MNDAEPFGALLDLLANDPRAPTSVTDHEQARQIHIEDSLCGLQVEAVTTATAIADLGAGAGLPGLVLAASLPAVHVDLIESVSKKCSFLQEAIERMALRNARAVCARSEEWAAGDGRHGYQAITARAVGRLATLAELASPLLTEGGILVAWKGTRDHEEEAEAERAGALTAMEPIEIRPVKPYPASRERHLHLLRKTGPTPAGIPRRPGIAAKRPFGAE